MELDKTKEKLRDMAFSWGARLFGICRVDDIRDNFHFEIRESADRFNTAISIGIPVSPAVLDTLTEKPNFLYKAHYQQINHLLNDIAFLISSEINELGYLSIPIPASQILKWKPMKAHLSHRVIAQLAGLGWNGRNNLLVNEKYGSQIRLVTVLTDMPLEIDRPVDMNCGDCYACCGKSSSDENGGTKPKVK